MFIFIIIGHIPILLIIEKGDLKRQLHSMDLTLINGTVNVKAIRKDLLPKEAGLHFIGKS